MTPAISSLLMVVGLWLTLALLCCGGGRYGDVRQYKVTYRVDGNGPASITYSNATGGTEQQEVRLPWTQTFEAQSGQFLYLSAQDMAGGALVTSSISVNGLVVKDAVSRGGYTIATVSDTCCETGAR